MNLKSNRPNRRPAAHLLAATLGALLLVLQLCGCATCPPKDASSTSGHRTFNFHTDTLAYANELTWEYHFNTNGQWTAHKRVPKPDYTLHCFVVAHVAEQFFFHARFEPTRPRTDDKTYRRLIHKVVHARASTPAVAIPGYANLREFSAAHEWLLKAESGGAWRSYFQRGNWRMVFPFSREHQERTAAQFLEALQQGCLPIAHLVCFPQETINHAVLIFGAEKSPEKIRFTVYDPNNPEKPANLFFDRASRTFSFPSNNYFAGGPVDVYRIYYRWNY